MNGKVLAALPAAPQTGPDPILLYVLGGITALAAIGLFLLCRYLWELRTRRVQQRLAAVRSRR